jgi:acyl-CoA reductase-like NAD-dependent aldehyde dehydrogenase
MAQQADATMLIDGERVLAAERIEVCNPARPHEVVGTVPRATPHHVDRAVAAAAAAQPAWEALGFSRRAQALAEALQRASVDIEARARLFVRENGKTLAEATREIGDVARRAQLTLELAPQLEQGRQLPSSSGRTEVRWRPHGVVVSIVPWNAPVSLACMQVIPALLAGNAVVVKAPESCPLALLQTLELIAQGLPAGLVNTVTGLPGEIGDALTMHPGVGKIGFTGSIPSARRILANAAQGIRSVTTELGGNDPAIILPDAVLDDGMMQQLAAIVFRMTGQVCMAIKRIYVHEAVHDQFLQRLAAAMDPIVVGDGLQPGVTMGPLHTRAALERAHALVADARERGATVRLLGRIHEPSTFAQGHFMQPTLVSDVDDDARLVAEEQFCPAIPVIRYRDTSEALERANRTPFGLGGSVWGRDTDAAARLAWSIQAGTVFVNTHGTNAVNRHAPYGGWKQSGNGRRAGLEGVQEYMQTQTLTVQSA